MEGGRSHFWLGVGVWEFGFWHWVVGFGTARNWSWTFRIQFWELGFMVMITMMGLDAVIIFLRGGVMGWIRVSKRTGERKGKEVRCCAIYEVCWLVYMYVSISAARLLLGGW